MRRLLASLAAALGGLALYRLLRRRRARPLGDEAPGGSPAEAGAGPEGGPDPRADELRRKLAESRALVDERESFEEGETTLDRADPEAGVDARRREVHERGRAAADEMRASEGADP